MGYDNCPGRLRTSMSAWLGSLTLGTNDFIGIQRLVSNHPAYFALADHRGGHRILWRLHPTTNINITGAQLAGSQFPPRASVHAYAVSAHQLLQAPALEVSSETTSPTGSDNPVRQSTGELGGVCHGGHSPCAIESGFPVRLAHIFQSHGRA